LFASRVQISSQICRLKERYRKAPSIHNLPSRALSNSRSIAAGPEILLALATSATAPETTAAASELPWWRPNNRRFSRGEAGCAQ
jgi:hypothetical protein